MGFPVTVKNFTDHLPLLWSEFVPTTTPALNYQLASKIKLPCLSLENLKLYGKIRAIQLEQHIMRK